VVRHDLNRTYRISTLGSMSTSDLGSIYGQMDQPITGLVFYLVHRKGRLKFIGLKEKLEGKVEIIELTEEELVENEEEELYVPAIFRNQEQRILLRTAVDKVILTPTSLFCKATLDNPRIFTYQNYSVLVINSTEVYFLILHDINTERNYLVILGSRARSKELLGIINRFLTSLGIVAVPSTLDPEMIEEVRTELKGELIDTILTNFPTPRIKTKRITGRGYEEEPSYLQDARMGSVHQHMFNYRMMNRLNPLVINLSEDGLVRFYNSISYRNYEEFLRRYIFHRLRQVKKPDVPLVGYSLDEIFGEED